MSVRDAPRPRRHVELELSSTRSIQSVLFKLLWRDTRSRSSRTALPLEISSLPRVDFSILDAPLDIHLSLCLAHSQTRLLPRSTFGRTRVQQNTRRVRSTNFPRSLMRKSPGCILRHSTLS